MVPFGEDAFVENMRSGVDAVLGSSDRLAFSNNLQGISTQAEAKSCKVFNITSHLNAFSRFVPRLWRLGSVRSPNT